MRGSNVVTSVLEGGTYTPSHQITMPPGRNTDPRWTRVLECHRTGLNLLWAECHKTGLDRMECGDCGENVTEPV